MKAATDFDCYADSYDRALEEALSAAGEGRQYFALERVKWLAGCLHRISFVALQALDYGCGTGSTSPLLLETLGAETVVGVDLSLRSLEVARRDHGSERIRFSPISDYRPAGTVDVAYTNGVFHHIPREDRGEALGFIRGSLRAGGLFSFWENNPWNPGTRHVMAHCVFDRDAVTLTPPEARGLLRSARFDIVRTDYLFIFPRALRVLRPLEKLVARLPLGAQYHILCRKPA